jgi:peptidoglycan hydrolase CwlO-like protein
MADYNGDLKVVSSQLGSLTKKIDRIDDKMDAVCDSVSRQDERIKRNTEEVGTLRTRSNVNDIAVAIAAAVTSAVAAVFGVRN